MRSSNANHSFYKQMDVLSPIDFACAVFGIVTTLGICHYLIGETDFWSRDE